MSVSDFKIIYILRERGRYSSSPKFSFEPRCKNASEINAFNRDAQDERK